MSEVYKRPKRVIKLRDDDPIFSLGMAAAFFDISAQLLRKKEKYFLDKDGSPLQFQRTPAGTRRYSLNDIIRIAHALRRYDKLTDRQLNLIVLRVDAFKEPIKKHRIRYRKGNNPE
jgi:hypothetical protein